MKDKRLDNHFRLIQIRGAINEIESFVTGINMDEFVSDSMISSAVLFQFTVIGEAVTHIDNELLNKYNYPWYQVRTFRNLISHEYFNIEFKAVWEIIIKDLPELKKLIAIIIQDFQVI